MQACSEACAVTDVHAVLQLSILLPCWDSFATEGLKDWLPEALWELPAVTDAGLHMSLVWGVLLTLCAVVTLVSINSSACKGILCGACAEVTRAVQPVRRCARLGVET
jgi:hypothetical protein